MYLIYHARKSLASNDTYTILLLISLAISFSALLVSYSIWNGLKSIDIAINQANLRDAVVVDLWYLRADYDINELREFFHTLDVRSVIEYTTSGAFPDECRVYINHDYLTYFDLDVTGGRTLQPDDFQLEEGTIPVLVNPKASRKYPLGYEWNGFENLRCKVVGILSKDNVLWLGLGYPLVSNKLPILIIPACSQWTDPDKVPEHFIRLYEVKTAILVPNEGADIKQLQNAIYSKLGMTENRGIARSMAERVRVQQNSRKPELTMVSTVAAITLLLGITGLFLVQLILVERRLYEIGIRLAVGASPGRLALGVLVESLIVGVVAIMIAMVVGLFTQQILGKSPDFFRFDFGVSLQVIGIGVVLTLFSAMLPTVYVSRLSPVDLIARKDL